MAQVTLENIKKIYPGNVEAVHSFDLDIANQSFVVLVGPSGCGKSTTLRMIAGLEEITEGVISIGGRQVNNVAPKDRDIAMVFQNYALYPHMTVYKNMAFGLKLRGMPKKEIDAKVRHAAEILGIPELLNRKPKALSGGQRQRVAVGRAIVRDPACFLFDEPLSNLDAKLRVEMRAELKRLHQRLKTTTIYVTHDQEEAMTLGDRVVVMKDGWVMQVGSALDVYRHPVSRFVAGFLGTPPMNFIEGRIARANGRLWFESGAQRVPVPDWAADSLSAPPDEPITLGARPECMALADEVDDASCGLDVTVGVVEPLGDTMDLRVSAERESELVARVRAREDVSPGDRVRLALNSDRLHFFGRERKVPGDEGVNLCLESEK